MTNNINLRHDALMQWVSLYVDIHKIQAITGDASFRRYCRVYSQEQSFIAVDALPIHENNQAFVQVARAFYHHNLKVPIVFQVDYEHGFLLLSDLGDLQLLKILNHDNVDQFYKMAMVNLLKVQPCTSFKEWQLPSYSESLLRQELSYFDEWYLGKHLDLKISSTEMAQLQEVYDCLIQSALSQPQVCVHRDYHSRNLMVQPDNELAVLDFQDAVLGPVTYDLVSLLRDCYINWPPDKIYSWVANYYELLIANKNMGQVSLETFIKWFDWMGLQRHLKVLGIFARLFLRDHKNLYLQDIPRILEYVSFVAGRYSEFSFLKEFILRRVILNEGNDISCRTRQTNEAAYG